MTPSSFEAPELHELQALLPAFEVEALIAQGGMGAVYKAQQRSLDRPVAIKILPREFGSNPDLRQSFETEARAMARLNHPNLIGIYASGNAKGLPYIVMEYVQGKSLFHSSHGKVIEDQQSVELIIEICRGLAHAHENGIIHRDIKPGNILLTPQRKPKIGDFGLALHTEAEDEGLAMGTPGYTAPEIYKDATCANERSDIFAVGVILYELLTGGLPDSDRTPPSAIVGTDPRLDEIWEKATNRNPSQRYAKVSDMRRDLELWLDPSSKPTELENAEPQLVTTVGANWSLLRNFIIIAILLVAIGAMWKGYQGVQESRAAKAATPTEAPPAPPVEPTPPPPEPSPPVVPPTPPVPTPPPVVKEESPAEILTRLRPVLLKGRRDEFPPTSIQSDTTAYFFVTKPMSWEDARLFAEDHGGNLPLMDDADAMTWLASNLPGGTTWIGTTSAQDGNWRQLDGNTWPLESPPKGDGIHAALQRDKTPIAQAATATHPFFIQWKLDGSKPCALENVFARTKESLETDAPFYPLGSIAANGSHYLFVTRETSAPDARRLAEIAGAHLMVPSDEAEADWLQSQAAERTLTGPFLLGASRKKFLWRWDTGEAWTFGRWASELPATKGETLALDGAEGWRHWRLHAAAAGFILEWSNPVPVEENNDLAELREKASDLLTNLSNKRKKELQENTKVMVWDLDGWLRSRTQEDIRRFTPAVNNLKNAIRKDRVPKFLRHRQERSLPAQVVTIKKAAHDKQDRIDNAFDLGAAKVRDAYRKRIADIIITERERGQLDLANHLEAAAAATTGLKKWMSSLDIVAADDGPILSPIEILSAKYGSRGRHADVTAKVKQFIEVDQKPFRVLASHLGADPDPGWNKSVYISFVVNGQTFGRWWNRNSLVSPDILMEHVASKTNPAHP